MKIVVKVITMIIIAGFFNMGSAAETEVHGRLYANWNMNLTDGADNFNEFALTRTYVTVITKLSEYTSAKITSDLRQIDGKYDIILKHGYLEWQPVFTKSYVTFRFGLQPILYSKNIDMVWGRRYLEQNISNLRKFITSADLGATALIDLGKKKKYGYVGLSVLNGTSYTDTQELNKQKDFNIFANVTPLISVESLKNSNLTGQFYSGTQNEEIGEGVESSDWKRELFSIGGNLAYENIFDVGFDLNFVTMGQGAEAEEVNKSGHSVFGTIYLERLAETAPILRTLNLFTRIDLYDPDTDLDDNGETVAIIGLECIPVKGFKAAINYRSTSFENDDEETESYIYLNTLVRF